MKRLLALVLVFSLVFPAFAWAVEGDEPLPPAEEITVPEEGTEETTSYAIRIFGYVIVVVPGAEESPATVGLFAAGEDGAPTEEISSFTVGGILGQAVSTVAKTVSPGPEHGKVVSAFVHEAIRVRKEAREQAKEEEKEEKRAEIRQRQEERKALKEEAREQRPLEKETRKNERQKGGRRGDIETPEED